jgi:hypothetical protein
MTRYLVLVCFSSFPKLFFGNMREQKRKAPDPAFWSGAFLKVCVEKVYTRTTDPTSRGYARRAISLPSASIILGMLKEDVPLARDDDTDKVFTYPSPFTTVLKSVERLPNFLHIGTAYRTVFFPSTLFREKFYFSQYTATILVRILLWFPCRCLCATCWATVTADIARTVTSTVPRLPLSVLAEKGDDCEKNSLC